MVEAYPLKYPSGWKRTTKPQKSRFDRSFTSIRYDLFNELKLMGAKNVVLSSNLILRRDNLPYVNQKQPDDKGVAVYFIRDNKEQCIPCDKWNRVEDNIQAIVKTIGALRGIERWGAKDMVDAAFRGFQALPHYVESDNALINTTIISSKEYFYDCHDKEQLKKRFRELSKELHPDFNNGDDNNFKEMKKQYDEKLRGF